VGVEIGAALKNVVAIAAGICDGLGFGDSRRERSSREAWSRSRGSERRSGQGRDTFRGFAGMGDLIATAMSRHSRNRRLGEAIGKGMKVERRSPRRRWSWRVWNGSRCGRSARRHGVELPIAEQVRSILYDGKSAKAAIRELLTRDLKSEPRSLTRR